MDGVDVDDGFVQAERVAQVLVRVDELLLGFHVDLAGDGFRLFESKPIRFISLISPERP